MITTPEECESQLTTVLYPVTDLVRFRDSKGEAWEDYDSLIDLITTTVALQNTTPTLSTWVITWLERLIPW